MWCDDIEKCKMYKLKNCIKKTIPAESQPAVPSSPDL